MLNQSVQSKPSSRCARAILSLLARRAVEDDHPEVALELEVTAFKVTLGHRHCGKCGCIAVHGEQHQAKRCFRLRLCFPSLLTWAWCCLSAASVAASASASACAPSGRGAARAARVSRRDSRSRVALPVCPRPRPRPRRRHRKKIALRSSSGHSSFTRWRPAAPPLAKFRKSDETTKVSPKSVSSWLH